MSKACCNEFTKWVKSFTKMERALTVLEAGLLVTLIALLVLVILHLVVCSKPYYWTEVFQMATTKINTYEDQGGIGSSATESGKFKIYNKSRNANGSTTKPDVKCSWSPSAKTTVEIHYYEDGYTKSSISFEEDKSTHNPLEKLKVDESIVTEMNEAGGTIDISTEISFINESIHSHTTNTATDDFEKMVRDELSDGEEVENEYDHHIVALVKLKPPKDIIFGCILTIVSEYWTLTAASCIEAIEETDSLDSFVIMEHYGTDKKGPFRNVDDVQFHPLYEGKNKTYDLAALKSAGSLTASGARAPAELASFLDFALLTLAEKFIILGYGPFRTIDDGPTGRRLRRAYVYKLPPRQCAGGGAALRHLGGGRAVPRGACGGGALCAGVLRARAAPCLYCGGAPLLLRGARALLAVMSAAPQCGAACEPALYVSLPEPDVADWLDATLRSDIIQ